jgi:hypothetical protein
MAGLDLSKHETHEPIIAKTGSTDNLSQGIIQAKVDLN